MLNICLKAFSQNQILYQMAKLSIFLQKIVLHTHDFDILLEESLKEQNTLSWIWIQNGTVILREM